MNKLTIGEYFSFLIDQMTLHPELSSHPLYSPEGILFGWEDHNVTARRFGTSEFEVRVMVNQELLEGIKSNDHLIIPCMAPKPETPPLPDLLEGFEDEHTHSGLISEEP